MRRARTPTGCGSLGRSDDGHRQRAIRRRRAPAHRARGGARPGRDLRRGRRLPAACWRRSAARSGGTSARCGCRPTPRARSCAARTPGTALHARSPAFAATSRSVMLAPGQGMPGEVWQTGRPAWIADADTHPRPLPRARAAAAGGAALRLRLPGPLRGEGARRHGVLRRRARRARRPAAGHDEQPGVADRPVRRALPCRARRARERGAQDGDPQRRVRLHHHDGRQREHRRGQRGHRVDLRLHAPRRWWAASSRSS